MRNSFESPLWGLLPLLALSAACFSPLKAQVGFSVTNLPSQLGDYHRAYVASDGVSVSGLLGTPGGPQRWDFSQAQGSNEGIQRLDVVAPTDGGYSGSFPQATYAERLTAESDGSRSWSYYHVVTNQGRAYYGFVDANSNPDMPVKVFASPTIDLPEPIQFGQTWKRAVDYSDFAVFITFAVHFTAQASVDAYGTLALPGIGDVPALRVNEVHEYDYIGMTLGYLNYTNYFRDYYWLVPGIGKAVEVISNASSAGPPPARLTSAGTMSRIFEASGVQLAAYPVTGLRIRRQNGQAVLDWQADTNATGYEVHASPQPSGAAWHSVAAPTTNTWSEPATNTQRFFQVLAHP